MFKEKKAVCGYTLRCEEKTVRGAIKCGKKALTERMKSTVQTEDSEHIPQTEQNGGTSTEDMKSKKPKKRNADRGRVNESRRIKNFGRGKKQDSEKSSGSSILRSCGHSGKISFY